MSGPGGEPQRTDWLALIVARWRTIVVCTALTSAASIAYAFLAPAWYESTLTVIQSQRSHESAAMALAATLPGAFDTMSTDVQRINAVLTSTSVADAVIAKFDLQKRYGASYIEQARETLWVHCSTRADRKSGVVALSCEDRDPKTAMAMAAYFGEVGNQVFARVSGSSAREEAKFLETQVTKARHDVDEASRALREFQEKHQIIDLPEQSKAVISAMASLKGDLLSKQLELSYLSGFSSPTESTVIQMRKQIAILEGKLRELEATQGTDAGSAAPVPTGSAGSGSEFFPNAMDVPKLRLELEQLLREQKIQETLFGLLSQRYEMAQVESARDTSTFQILDAPTLPTLRARPKRRKLAELGALGGLVIALAVIMLPPWWRRRRFA